jgi:3-phosphoshikimate 1-carboxyvinyltransferase
MRIVTLKTENKVLKGEIVLPSSKSISNRTLIIDFLSSDKLHLRNLSKSDDTQLMIRLLDRIANSKLGKNGVELNCHNAGTVLRFLTAVLANQSGSWILTGNDRMKERPIGILVEALRKIGADIIYLGKKGFPPIQIFGKTLTGGKLKIDGSVSSQFISAILLIAPQLEKGIQLHITNKISSKPYIEMTLGILNHFGVRSEWLEKEIVIRNQNYVNRELEIEPDWSAAAYWYELAALSDDADIILRNLCFSSPSKSSQTSVQGDSILPKIFESLGVRTALIENGIRLTKTENFTSNFNFDFTHHPDLAQPVILTCAALGIEGIFTGLKSLRVKETNRLQALHTELLNCGFINHIIKDTQINLQRNIPYRFRQNRIPTIKTYGDHRMALAFAPLVLHFNGIQIENPIVVSKSYPGYWDDLRKLPLNVQFHG